MSGPTLIDEATVPRLLTMGDAIDVLHRAYLGVGAGKVLSMARAHVRVDDRILHAVGGVLLNEGVAGTKTWLYTPNGAAPRVLLFDLADGALVGQVDAFALGQLRTAGTSGLATRLLARPDARRLGLVGTGKQAFAQARAVHEVRPLDHVALFGREPSRRGRLATRLADELGVTVSEHDRVADALEGADIVTLVTRAAEPIVAAELIEPGVHINAVGAMTPDRQELEAQAVGVINTIVADSVEQARADSGELRAAVESGVLDWRCVHALGDVLAHRTDARERHETTLFKALGVGFADVALAHEALRRARASRLHVGADLSGHATTTT